MRGWRSLCAVGGRSLGDCGAGRAGQRLRADVPRRVEWKLCRGSRDKEAWLDTGRGSCRIRLPRSGFALPPEHAFEADPVGPGPGFPIGQFVKEG